MRINKLELLMTCTCLSLIMSSQKANAEHRIQYAPADAQKIANDENNSIAFTYSHGSRIGTTLTAKDPYSFEGNSDTSSEENESESEFGPDGISKITGTIYGEKGYTLSGFTSSGYHYKTGTLYDEDGYNRDGYNRAGYNRDGYNKDGWNENGINKVTGTNFDIAGFDKNGYNIDGYNSKGFDKNGYNIYGYDSGGFDKDGYDIAGFNRRARHKDTGTYKNQDGFYNGDTKKVNAAGYDYRGFDAEGINKYTGTQYDALGFDKDGYNADGYNAKGFDRDGYNVLGYDSSGYKEDGYNYKGYDSSGYGRDGYNTSGWNSDGINKETGNLYDVNGFDKNGYADNGSRYNNDGYNKSGYDSSGYDSAGFNSYGWNAEGINRETGTLYNTSGYDRQGYDVQGYNYEGWSAEANNYATGTPYDSDGYDINGYDENGHFMCGYNEAIQYNGRIRTCYFMCFTGDMPVTLADGSTKRADEICYDDELLVWNFDDGKFASAKPIWIKIEQVAQEYNYMRFSDGSVLKTINQHRIFNQEAGKFTYPMTDDTPLGTHTLNSKGELVALVEKKIVKEEVKYYNIMTERYINCFVGGVLTSCRLNNIYPIKDLKFVKDNRKIVPYEQFAELDRKWYDGLRLGEQPSEINHKGDVDFNDKSLVDYVKRNLKIMA